MKWGGSGREEVKDPQGNGIKGMAIEGFMGTEDGQGKSKAE